jgi:hypothetical protein
VTELDIETGKDKQMDLRKIDKAGKFRQFTISGIPYEKIVREIGEPHVDDDPDKVDASWHVVDEDTGRHLAIWNYKNGPAYTGEGSVHDITYWSAWGDESLAQELFL